MGRSIKKGPYVDSKLFKKIEEMNSTNSKKAVKNMVKTIYYIS